jgi:hypothetical protein
MRWRSAAGKTGGFRRCGGELGIDTTRRLNTNADQSSIMFDVKVVIEQKSETLVPGVCRKTLILSQ